MSAASEGLARWHAYMDGTREPAALRALLAGDAQVISDIFRERVAYRGAKDAAWGNGDELFHDASKLNKQGGSA